MKVWDDYSGSEFPKKLRNRWGLWISHWNHKSQRFGSYLAKTSEPVRFVIFTWNSQTLAVLVFTPKPVTAQVCAFDVKITCLNGTMFLAKLPNRWALWISHVNVLFQRFGSFCTKLMNRWGLWFSHPNHKPQRFEVSLIYWYMLVYWCISILTY